MKAITLWQPWASLLACGAKKYETRSWATSYRGPIAIHAGKKPYNLGDIEFGLIRGLEDAAESALGIYEANNLPLGAVVATAELVGCYLMAIDAESGCVCIETLEHGREMPSAREYMFGDWTPGRYAWEFANMRMLPEPIPARGGQRLWNWEGEQG